MTGGKGNERDVKEKKDKREAQITELFEMEKKRKRQKRILSPATKFYNYDNLMSTEEERMVKLAIKNSLVETQSNN